MRAVRPGRLVCAFALAAIAASAPRAAAQPPGPATAPRLAPPRIVPDGTLRWPMASEAVPAELAPWRRSLEGPGATDSSRLAAWRALARHPRWRL